METPGATAHPAETDCPGCGAWQRQIDGERAGLLKGEKGGGHRWNHARPASGRAVPSDETAGYNRQLFQQLRTKRKELADAASVPPYVIFSDRSLQEMQPISLTLKQRWKGCTALVRRKLQDTPTSSYPSSPLIVRNRGCQRSKTISWLHFRFKTFQTPQPGSRRTLPDRRIADPTDASLWSETPDAHLSFGKVRAIRKCATRRTIPRRVPVVIRDARTGAGSLRQLGAGLSAPGF